MFAIIRGRLIAAAFSLTATVATAQAPLAYGPVVGCPLGNCAAANHGTYGPALFAVNPHKKHFPLAGPDEPSCVGRSSYPLSDWHYIRQFCGPTLQPGTCYGHHQTKWRKWEETCASVGGCATGVEVVPPAPLMVAPPGPIVPTVPHQPETLPQPKPDVPKSDLPKVDPVAPPKLPLEPKKDVSPAPLPIVPLPTEPGKEPGKISMTEAVVPMPMPSVVPPQPEPRVVVPPK